MYIHKITANEKLRINHKSRTYLQANVDFSKNACFIYNNDNDNNNNNNNKNNVARPVNVCMQTPLNR